MRSSNGKRCVICLGASSIAGNPNSFSVEPICECHHGLTWHARLLQIHGTENASASEWVDPHHLSGGRLVFPADDDQIQRTSDSIVSNPGAKSVLRATLSECGRVGDLFSCCACAVAGEVPEKQVSEPRDAAFSAGFWLSIANASHPSSV